jgi:hypothetical protein
MNTTLSLGLFISLITHEVKVRMRRKSSWVVLLLMLSLAWLMIPDPASGKTLLVIDHFRIRYTSNVLALSGVSMFGFLMGLFGFYLIRGRTVEDIRCGLASLIASTPASNLYLISARVIGLALFLLILMVAYFISVTTVHFVRGEGVYELWVYVQVFVVVGFPMLFITASLAVLFDSVHFLIGKRGDVLYFFLWMLHVTQLDKVKKLLSEGQVWASLLDLNGFVFSLEKLRGNMEAKMFSHGINSFDASISSVTLPTLTWTAHEIFMRFVALLMCLLPTLLAAYFFHRYSPELVKVSRGQKRRSPLELLNIWSRPLAKFVHFLFKLSTRLNNLLGQMLAEIGLSLVSAPFAVLVIFVVNVLALLVPQAALSPMLVGVVAFWGILICDVFTRDYQVDLEWISLAISGRYRRFLRQMGASVGLGFLLCGLIAVRLFAQDYMLAFVLLMGLLSLSSFAAALGLMTKTSRSFMSLFLFWWFFAIQVPTSSVIDVVGFNRSANWNTMQWQLLFMLLACTLSFLVLRFQTDKR